MRSVVLVVVGILLALAGGLFALQGFGFVEGSPMTGTTTWSIAGPVIALVGLGLIYLGWRTGRR
jgi:drug/metabolite transporter superfamily protein YnfA